jgi:hypothetical protein
MHYYSAFVQVFFRIIKKEVEHNTFNTPESCLIQCVIHIINTKLHIPNTPELCPTSKSDVKHKRE